MKIKEPLRRWWYGKSKGRTYALVMLVLLIGAAVLDRALPKVSSEPCPTPIPTVLPDAPGVMNQPTPLPLVTSAPVETKLANAATVAADLVDSSVRYHEWFNREARRVDIPPKILARWAWWESNLITKSVSRDGYYSRGIGEFIRPTWEENAAKYGYTWDDAFDPEKNIRVMADYMAFCRSYVARPGMTEAEIVRLMLAAYNRGPAGAAKYGIRGLPSRSLKAIADTMRYGGY